MDSEKILKKIQKKQRMLLKLLTSQTLESDEEGRLNKIAAGLRRMELVEPETLSITADGERFAAEYEELLFHDIVDDDEIILDKLLQRKAPSASLIPKLKMRERLFLTFLSEGPVDPANIRGAKNLIPHLLNLGKILVSSEGVNLTDVGRQELGEDISPDVKAEAMQRFFTTARSEARNKLEDRAERFLALYRNGFTYQEIGDLHSLTRERVRQILNITPNFAAYLLEHEEAERQREIQKQKNARLKKIEKSLANQFPERVDELWDLEKNEGLDPAKISSRSATVEIWWKCPKDGHSWKKRPSDIAVSWWRSKTSGCPKCAGKTKKPVRQRTIISAFPDFVRDYWDFEKNQARGLDPNEVRIASNLKAWFKCPKDSHVWEVRIHAIVRQQWSRGNAGCRVCNGTVGRRIGKWKKARTLSEAFPEQVRGYWDVERNNKIKLSPSDVTAGSSKEAWFRCPVDGHSWRAKVTAIRQSWRNGSSGCPQCHGHTQRKSHKLRDIYSTFIAEFWDFEQNEANGLNYESLTTGSNRIASFNCPKDGTTWHEPISSIVKYWATGRSGCPKCTGSRKTRN